MNGITHAAQPVDFDPTVVYRDKEKEKKLRGKAKAKAEQSSNVLKNLEMARTVQVVVHDHPKPASSSMQAAPGVQQGSGTQSLDSKSGRLDATARAPTVLGLKQLGDRGEAKKVDGLGGCFSSAV